MKYVVSISVRLSRGVIIDAESAEAAEAKAYDLLDSEKVILGSDDSCAETECNTIREADEDELEYYENY